MLGCHEIGGATIVAKVRLMLMLMMSKAQLFLQFPDPCSAVFNGAFALLQGVLEVAFLGRPRLRNAKTRNPQRNQHHSKGDQDGEEQLVPVVIHLRQKKVFFGQTVVLFRQQTFVCGICKGEKTLRIVQQQCDVVPILKFHALQVRHAILDQRNQIHHRV